MLLDTREHELLQLQELEKHDDGLLAGLHGGGGLLAGSGWRPGAGQRPVPCALPLRPVVLRGHVLYAGEGLVVLCMCFQ